MKPVEVTTQIDRKDPRLPRFVVVPTVSIKSWKLAATTTVIGTLNGHAMGRRGIKQWDDQRWFIELPQPLCQAAGVDTGDRVTLVIQLAPEELPAELEALLATDPRAKQAWSRLPSGSQRMLREHVAAAKQTSTRARRAAAGLGLPR